MVGDYFDRVNPDLLALIPPDAGTVLEIGCGAGAMCEAYRRRNPAVVWRGIEPNEEAAAVAQARGIDVECRGVESSAGWPSDVPRSDVLVMGDVLEHLVDPWATLKRVADEWLRPGGLVLACIPNAQHWSVIRSLLGGEWEYQDEGLLDRTHLRWFTLRSIKAMFAGAGLDIFEIRARQLCNEGHPEFIRAMEGEAATRLGLDFDAFERQTRVYQWVVRARKPAYVVEIGKCDAGGRPLPGETRGIYPGYDRPLHLHAVLDRSPVNGSVCIRPRILEPFEALATIPGVTTSIDDSTGKAAMPDRHGRIPADRDAVLIFQRSTADRARCIDIAARVLAEKPRCVTAYEIDDHPSILPDPSVLACFHAVQCSTEPLAERVRRWNPNVFVVPNQLAELPPPREERDPADGVAIFFGALNREQDWKPIIDPLNRVLRDHRDVTVRVIHDRAFYDALETTDKTFTPFCEYAQYRRILRTCDIALLPLEPSEFSRTKSDLKFLECAAEGVAVLAGGEAYRGTLCDRPDEAPEIGFMYSCPLSFEVALRVLVGRPETRRACARAAYEYVRDHRMLRHHYRKTHALYLGLLARKSELDAQLIGRVPELGQSKTPENAGV